jgi:hypothetical protein
MGDAERYMACMEEMEKAKGLFYLRLMGGT